MRIFVSIIFLLLLCALPAQAVVELALEGDQPQRLEEVYLRDGVAFLAVDDVLDLLGSRGDWDSVAHLYRFRTPRGTAVISPGSRFIKLGERFIPLANKPRFIDGRLRVPEDFIARHLSGLLDQKIYYRNFNPSATQKEEGSALDRFFSFLLRKKKPVDAPVLRAVAIDPGHGGQDPGSIGINGVKEKSVTLAVAQSLQKQIKMQLGIPIYLSRDDDYGLTLEERLKAAAHPDVDALLLLHAQAAEVYKPQGIYLYVRRAESLPGENVNNDDKDSRRLAENLASALRDSGLTVHGVSEAPLLPLGQGDLPTVLIEMGYLTNPADQMLLNESEGQKQLAQALFKGLKKFGAQRSKENMRDTR